METKKQKYEVCIRESSITINNHLKPFEIVECDFVNYDGDKIVFEGDSGELAVYNWADVIKLVRLGSAS